MSVTRCSAACWEDAKRKEAELRTVMDRSIERADMIAELNTRLAEMTRDRDEWRDQHENLLAIYQAEVSKHQASLLRVVEALKIADRAMTRDFCGWGDELNAIRTALSPHKET